MTDSCIVPHFLRACNEISMAAKIARWAGEPQVANDIEQLAQNLREILLVRTLAPMKQESAKA